MVENLQLKSRAEWLKERVKRLGGSDAAAIVGMNPYTSNVDLWEIKTGKRKPADLSGNDLVKYGTNAEKYLRELFKLDHPQYEIFYTANNLWVNDKFPFAHASLDGLLKDEKGRIGILEIKTATIESATQKAKWNDRIPDNYYCQLCWYMGVMEAEFAVLVAQLKYERNGDLYKATKHYYFNRYEMQEDIEYMMRKGSEFYDYIKNDTPPPLILPQI